MQGLIFEDTLSLAMSIDTRDQSEIRKYYKKFLTIQESTFFSVRLKNGRSTVKMFPLKNLGLQLQIEPLLCNLQIFPATHKILTIFLTTPMGSVFMNALFLL